MSEKKNIVRYKSFRTSTRDSVLGIRDSVFLKLGQQLLTGRIWISISRFVGLKLLTFSTTDEQTNIRSHKWLFKLVLNINLQFILNHAVGIKFVNSILTGPKTG